MKRHHAELGNVSIPAIWSLSKFDPLASIYKCKVILNDEKPYTPDSIDFTVSKQLLTSVENTGFENSSINLSKDYWKNRAKGFEEFYGMTEAEFRVLKHTNFNGYHLAKEFELRRFIILRNASGSKIRQLRSVINGKLRNVRAYEGILGVAQNRYAN